MIKNNHKWKIARDDTIFNTQIPHINTASKRVNSSHFVNFFSMFFLRMLDSTSRDVNQELCNFTKLKRGYRVSATNLSDDRHHLHFSWVSLSARKLSRLKPREKERREWEKKYVLENVDVELSIISADNARTSIILVRFADHVNGKSFGLICALRAPSRLSE